ncbi:MAG TPA: hypothetical protein HA348_02265 [Thermoplasmata archaeon]|nr:hypothetical protein [Thermoplasmata archaeon]
MWNGPLEKIDRYRYRIPSSYHGERGNVRMRAEGLIFASPSMIDQIKRDNALEQVANVATLPGLVGGSMAMPDIHSGYGFSIGGVAATDSEEGVISPGGVGFDINCLSGSTEVAMGDGGLEEIKNLNCKEKVLIFDYLKNRVEKAQIRLALEKRDRIFEISTKGGYHIYATLDHPILTSEGMREVKYLGKGDSVGIYDEEFGFDAIKSIRPKGVEEVFDITVSSPLHNFIANNFVVSNCGVRLLRTNLTSNDLDEKRVRGLVDQMFANVPSGVGSKGKVRLGGKEIEEVLEEGAKWAVDNGYGWEDDLEFIEEKGQMKTADSSLVSEDAKRRGIPQLGSLGAGNHFLEIQRVEEIYEPEVAKTFGIENKGQIAVMIHTGSRGCGHQICTDYLRVLERAVRKYNIDLPDRQLACAPVKSKEAEDYFKAMACGANFAFANRQMITHWVREAFEKTLNYSAKDMGLKVIYDVCHNIAKLEEHEVDKKRKKVYVHRKGATRAFCKGLEQVPTEYRSVGQPVLIPGDMGTASYLLVGTEQAMKETWGTTCHGAGRLMSRTRARREFRANEIIDALKKKGTYIRAASLKVVTEEAPDAYKDVSQVVEAVEGVGISRKVAKMTPLGVVKG